MTNANLYRNLYTVLKLHLVSFVIV